MAYSVYRSPMMAKQMTIKTTKLIWCPVPIRAENKSGWEAGLKTSPWTCFHPYSSPEKNKETVLNKTEKSLSPIDRQTTKLWAYEAAQVSKKAKEFYEIFHLDLMFTTKDQI